MDCSWAVERMRSYGRSRNSSNDDELSDSSSAERSYGGDLGEMHVDEVCPRLSFFLCPKSCRV